MYRKLLGRFLKTLAVALVFAIAGIAVLLGLLWLDHTRETTLPTPTGPFAVGRTTYVWSDATHADPMAPQPGTKRELLAWMFVLRSLAAHLPRGPERKATKVQATGTRLGRFPFDARDRFEPSVPA